MKHQLAWDKKLLENFVELALLNDEEKKIMEYRVKYHLTPLQTSLKMTAEDYPVNELYINRKIQKIKKIYDEIQKRYPEEFPLRVKNGKDKI